MMGVVNNSLFGLGEETLEESIKFEDFVSS